MEKFISDIITESSLDSRIPSGILNLENIEHIQVVAERIYDACENEQVVNEFLKSFINEGKYPERQAFNKDGWLVTFPSKEYRDAALKKGTHSISDPTHGKGGMNLYYKKKGKQKRQTQQVTTAIDPQQQQTQLPAKQPTTQAPTEKPSAPPPSAQSADAAARAKRLAKLTGQKPTQEPEKQATPAPAQPAVQPAVQSRSSTTKQEPVPDSPKPADTPAIDVPVVTTPSQEYASVSKKFAAKKGWMSEPYGEYRDRDGNTVAVVGLSGEVVPTKSVDRDEYKLFAEKSMM